MNLQPIIETLCMAAVAVASFKIGKLYGWDQGMKDCSRIWKTDKERTLSKMRQQLREIEEINATLDKGKKQ